MYDINLNKLSITCEFAINGPTPEFGYLDEPNGTFHTFSSTLTSGVELDLSAEPAAPKYIAVRYPGGATSLAFVKINSLSVRRTPGCEKLDAPTAVPGIGSAEISWTAGSESAWNLQYKLASAPLWTSVSGTITNPFTLDGLTQGASYKVRVQAACAVDDLGDWSNETTFTTNCNTIDVIPFTETFDAALSNCWAVYDDNTEYYATYVFSSELRLPGGKTGAGHVVVLPTISADLSNATMTIRYKCNTGANYATPQIGQMADKGDLSTFNTIAELEKSNSYTIARIPLSTHTPGTNLAIRYAGGTSEGELTIDELRISHVEVFEDEEGLDNETRLGTLDGQTIDFVMARPILSDGDYNTICLPFDLSASQLSDAKCPLNGFEIRRYDHANVDLAADQVDLFLQTVNGIEAGKAFFIRNLGEPTAVKTYAEFRDVVISASEVETPAKDAAGIIFKGAFNPFELTGGDAKNLYLSTNSLLYYPNSNFIIKGFRGYVLVDEGGAALPVIRRGARVRISEPQDAPTGVDNVQGNKVQCTKVLEDGQVVIIRNGVKYTLQGQIIK